MKKVVNTAIMVVLMIFGLIGIAEVMTNSSTEVLVPLEVVIDLADTVEQVMPSTVHIENVGICQGSGAIITRDGVVVTAKHVVEGGDSFIVTLNDGSRHATNLVIEDEQHDIAFLKIQTGGFLPKVCLSDMDYMRVGDDVFICGSPFGFDNFNSVSAGILSYRQRDLDAEWDSGYGWEVTFQSDSAANPGNSGGPVFNREGKCIGVLVAGMSEGVNYSVPCSVFMDELDVIELMFKIQRFDERMEREYYEEYYELQ